jgi:hypothetical protein
MKSKCGSCVRNKVPGQAQKQERVLCASDAIFLTVNVTNKIKETFMTLIPQNNKPITKRGRGLSSIRRHATPKSKARSVQPKAKRTPFETTAGS